MPAGAAGDVLGAGGTARAALAAAARLGAARSPWYARRPVGGGAAAAGGGALGVELVAAAWPDAAAHTRADLVVSTVPKGVADPLAADAAGAVGTVLFDALYDPWPTPLAAAASAAGCPVVSGLDLLLAQAVASSPCSPGCRRRSTRCARRSPRRGADRRSAGVDPPVVRCGAPLTRIADFPVNQA